jgi:hypothetical protein
MDNTLQLDHVLIWVDKNAPEMEIFKKSELPVLYPENIQDLSIAVPLGLIAGHSAHQTIDQETDNN